MNKREAKQQAYLRAASILQTALDGADPDYLLEIYGNEEDAAKVEAGITEIIRFLDSRAPAGEVAVARADRARGR